MRVEVGPVSRESAEAWFEYAQSVLAELGDLGADRAPPDVLEAFRVLLDEWRSGFDSDPAGSGPFHWVAERSDDEVGYLINGLYEVGCAVEVAHELGKLRLRPHEADEFHYAVVNQVLTELAAEGGSQSHLVEILREHWGVAGP